MKRIPALILLVCLAAAACLTTATADDYVDDVYFVSASKQAEKPAKKQQASASKQQTKTQTSTAKTGTATQPATGGSEKVRFVQVSDTVVKAVISR